MCVGCNLACMIEEVHGSFFGPFMLPTKKVDLFANKKTHICFENTPRHIPTSHLPEFLLWQVNQKVKAFRSSWNVSENIFLPRDLGLWPMTLTYKVDFDIHPLNHHAKIQVCMSVRLARRVRRTDTHADRHTDDVKTITAITSETWGVITGIGPARLLSLVCLI